jgi:hypothetical protein
MEVSMSVIINLTEHTNEFYAAHFCNFFCYLPLHRTYICLTFFCLITCAVYMTYKLNIAVLWNVMVGQHHILQDSSLHSCPY